MKKLFSVLFFVVAAFGAIALGAVASSYPELSALIPSNDTVNGIITASVFPLAVEAAGLRKFYKEINAAVANIPNGGFLAAPGDLRSEVQVTNTLSTYSFNIRDIQMNKTAFPASVGVQDNDLFVSYGLGLFWDSRTATYTNIQLQSYPNPTAAVAGGITTAQLYTFYNGLLNIQVGSTEFIKQLSTNTFMTIPAAQQSSTSDNSEFDLAAALKVIGPFPIFSGKADNKVVLNINTNGISDVAGDAQTVLTFWAKGVVINNGANDPRVYEAVLSALGRL